MTLLPTVQVCHTSFLGIMSAETAHRRLSRAGLCIHPRGRDRPTVLVPDERGTTAAGGFPVGIAEPAGAEPLYLGRARRRAGPDHGSLTAMRWFRPPAAHRRRCRARTARSYLTSRVP